MAVFSDVEHASAEVFSAVGRFEAEQLQDPERSGILNGFERAHESTGR